MDELIRKQDAIDAVNDVLAAYIPTFRPWQEEIPLDCALKIKALPPVQPKRGKWHTTNNSYVVLDVCDQCMRSVRHVAPFYDYCPHCGADMRGEAK